MENLILVVVIVEIVVVILEVVIEIVVIVEIVFVVTEVQQPQMLGHDLSSGERGVFVDAP
jgi:hypothetical protein